MFLARVSSVNGFDAVSVSGGGSEHPVEPFDRTSVRTLSSRLSCRFILYGAFFTLFLFFSLSLKLFASSASVSSSTLVITHCKLGTVFVLHDSFWMGNAN